MNLEYSSSTVRMYVLHVKEGGNRLKSTLSLSIVYVTLMRIAVGGFKLITYFTRMNE